MKRDMDLVRKILIFMSENTEGPNVDWAAKIPGYTEDQILHHAALMKQGGLIVAGDYGDLDSDLPIALPVSITWDGHEFLDAVRDSTVWEKAKKYVISPTGGVAFAVLKSWLETQATAALALVR